MSTESLTDLLKRAICTVLLCCGVIAAQETTPKVFEVSATKNLMGTEVDILAMHGNVSSCKIALYHAFREIERIEQLVSEHISTSEVALINAHAGESPVKVSYETLSLIKRAIGYAQTFDGAFDITIGPISSLWGFSSDHPVALPSPDSIKALLPLINYKKISLNESDTTVALLEKGMLLDLGGVAKGYAVDRAVMILKQNGVDNFLLKAGGDMFCSGFKAATQKWRIGIKHPRQPEALLAKFEIDNFAVSTSGDYERCAMIDGKRYHHIFDPQTGYPAEKSQSVTVLAPSAEVADAWSTYLFILGYEKYKCISTPAPGACLFVDASGKVNYDEALLLSYHLQFPN